MPEPKERQVTIAGELIARWAAAGTQAEKDRVEDEMFSRKVDRRRKPADIAAGTANGTLIYADGSGIEMTEVDDLDDYVLVREVAVIPVDSVEN
jgi:hypothetical protein